MKQKFFKKSFSFFLIGIFVFTIVGFFTFTFSARAACTYGIGRMDAQSSVNKTDQLKINATITRSGTAGDCSDLVTAVFFVKADYTTPNGDGGAISWTELQLTQTDMTFNGASSKSFAMPYSLSKLDWSKIPNQNQLQLFMRVYANSTNVTTSAIWNITVSGTSGSSAPSGAKNITISFDRGSYNKDDKVNIAIKLENPSGAPDVDIETSVNGKVIGTFSQTGANLGNSQAQIAAVNDANSFQNGTNNIVVKMYQSGSNKQIIFAQGSAQIQAQGLSATAPAAASGSTGSGAGTAGATNGNSTNDGTKTGPPVNCSDSSNFNNPDCLYNPLPTGNLTDMFLYIAKGFLAIIGIWAVIFIIVGGFRMVISQGNEEAVAQAKRTITWAVLGVVIAVLSFSIIAIVQDLLNVNIKQPTSSIETYVKNS